MSTVTGMNSLFRNPIKGQCSRHSNGFYGIKIYKKRNPSSLFNIYEYIYTIHVCQISADREIIDIDIAREYTINATLIVYTEKYFNSVLLLRVKKGEFL